MRILFILLMTPIWLLLWLSLNLCLVLYRFIVEAIFPTKIAATILAFLDYADPHEYFLPLALDKLLTDFYYGLPKRFVSAPLRGFSRFGSSFWF